MKTKNDFKELNYIEYAFFKGISTIDAKYYFADELLDEDWRNNKNLTTNTGLPKISKSDKISISNLDFKMRSNSFLDGACQFEYLCDYYNKGVHTNKLREFSETQRFIDAIGFTGKDVVVGEILNEEQYLKLKKTWLLKNSIYTITDKAIEFEIKNEWALEFLKENGVDMNSFIHEKEKWLSENNQKTYRK